jgi:hypothetical protein
MITGKTKGNSGAHSPYSLSIAALLLAASAFLVFLVARVFGR